MLMKLTTIYAYTVAETSGLGAQLPGRGYPRWTHVISSTQNLTQRIIAFCKPKGAIKMSM